MTIPFLYWCPALPSWAMLCWTNPLQPRRSSRWMSPLTCSGSNTGPSSYTEAFIHRGLLYQGWAIPSCLATLLTLYWLWCPMLGTPTPGGHPPHPALAFTGCAGWQSLCGHPPPLLSSNFLMAHSPVQKPFSSPWTDFSTLHEALPSPPGTPLPSVQPSALDCSSGTDNTLLIPL